MPITDNLVSYWSMEATAAGAAEPDQHGDNDAADYFAQGTSSAAGKVGNARQALAASFQGLEVTHDASLAHGAQDWTWCGWVYFNALSGGFNSRSVLAKADGGIRECEIYQFTNPSLQEVLTFRLFDGAAVADVHSTTILSAATWYWFCAWHDVSEKTLYLSINNSAPDSTTYTGTAPTTTANLYLLTNSGFASINGRGDEFAFLTRILTPDERTWIWNNGYGRTYARWQEGILPPPSSGQLVATAMRQDVGMGLRL